MTKQGRALLAGGLLAMALSAVSRDASAQSLPPPDRSAGWETVSTVAMVVGLGAGGGVAGGAREQPADAR